MASGITRTSAVELNSLSPYQPLSDGPGDIESGTPSQSATHDRAQASPWTAKRLLTLGLGAGTAALALTGGVAWLGAQHNASAGGLPQPAPAPGSTFAPTPPQGLVPPPPALAPPPPTPVPSKAAKFAAPACTFPKYELNSTASALLTKWYGDGQQKVPPLYGADGSGALDPNGIYQRALFTNGNSVGRATMLLRAADDVNLRPDIRQDGESYIVRMYDRDEATNGFFAVDVRVEAGDLGLYGKNMEAPAWWQVAMRAGVEIDEILGFVPPTIIPGDDADLNRFDRQTAETVTGGYTDVVTGNQLEAMRRFERGIINLYLSTYDNAIPRAFEDAVKAGDPEPQDLANLLAAKTDNWPSIFARMQDPQNVCMLTLSQPLDFRIEMWSKNTTDLTTPYGSKIRLGGTLGYFQDATPVEFTSPGHPTVSLKTGRGNPFAVMQADPTGAYIQGLGQSTTGRIWMPYDLLVASVADVTISRRPCLEDASSDRG